MKSLLILPGMKRSFSVEETIAWMYGTTVIEQRCIFHKLRNVADKCREDLKGEAHKETRKLLPEQVSVIYQAESAEEARQCLVALLSALSNGCATFLDSYTVI